uniref:Uncharacterized protein n=1 Tax=Pithovirus LCPAC201 TaxID=2506591 RepID=A0A481Z500_9VIRU|nr:MAG: hypothetical protein LCPAC201_02450 [Pithovirus LCPAC201]
MNKSLSLFVFIDDTVNCAANINISKDHVVMASSLKEAQRFLLKTHPYYIESGKTFESLSPQEEEEAISAMVREAGIFEIKVSEIKGIETLTSNFTQDFKDLGLGQNLICYAGLTEKQREKAWKSLMIWFTNPFDGESVHLTKIIFILRPLVKSEYFCPISDKDLIGKIFEPAQDRPSNECYIMLRLSQNKRPLVFVCALGGSSRIYRVRIGLPTDLNPEYTVLKEHSDTILHHNSDINIVIQELITSYARDRKVRRWYEINMNNV